MAIVWLASYPKSGNTWIRFLLHNYLYGEAAGSDEVNRRILDLHALPPGGMPPPEPGRPLLCKTHLLCGPKHPHFQRTAGFIYVIRNPRDVLLSNANYFRLTGAENLSEREFALEFIHNMGIPILRQRGMGSWLEHAVNWLAAAQAMPHVFLRYEDMKRDPGATLERMLRMLHEDVDADRIARAVEASSFDRMRNIEEREKRSGEGGITFGITDRSRRSDRYFMNKGASGQSLAHLGEDVERAFTARFSEVLGMLGY